MLASSAIELLVRSGRIRGDVPITGPQLLQFMSELGDELTQGREARLTEALDLAHAYIDDQYDEGQNLPVPLHDAVERSRVLRDELDPPADRVARGNAR